MFRARPNHIRPSEVSAKVQTTADHATRPGKHCPAVGQARPRHAAHDHAARAGNKPRGRATLAYHGRCIRPSRERTSHVRPRIGQISSARPRRPTVKSSGHDPTVRPIVPTDRPNAAVDPKPVLKPISYFQGPA
ncbi:unnamed protein product [Microthlaspi erraticum]|uniref:Uncharacterized protein n=1 Tax=Microthlaspi erraticum TaxID=1685480 RepID=A0A6D2HZT8_9BRAS|nr:unnamed protein product [Microthlaspi erraticum]